jgi:hypothetical protein
MGVALGFIVVSGIIFIGRNYIHTNLLDGDEVFTGKVEFKDLEVYKELRYQILMTFFCIGNLVFIYSFPIGAI